MISPLRAKAILKAKGWSYRTAAPILNVSYPHVSQVLNGHRHSLRLLRAIQQLPARRKA